MTDDVWRILDVIPNSTLGPAGLIPYSDCTIGTRDGLVHGESGFGGCVSTTPSLCLQLQMLYHWAATITTPHKWGDNGTLLCCADYLETAYCRL
jgi:hypothetical protein